jgi:NAD/NADP transhydrogenase beta subunit
MVRREPQWVRKTMMVFGDAKKVIEDLVKAIE